MKVIQRILLPLFLGISQIAPGQWIVYTPSNTKGIEATMVSSGLITTDNKLWFGTDLGVTCYDPAYSFWTSYNSGNGLNTNYIYQLFEDENGSVWAATNGGGISRYSNGSWTNFTVKDGLSYNVVRAISQSPDGTLWFGTYGHGICSYRAGTGFKKWASEGLDDSYVLSMLALSDELILIGTLNEGLIIFDRDTVRSPVNENELSGKKIFSIFRDHNNKIWLATDKGAQQYNPSTDILSSCPDSLQGKTIYSICENQANELVFASNNKIYTVSNGTWSSFIPDNMPYSTSFYSAFYDREGNGWFGSSNHGLYKKTGNSWYNFYNSQGLENANYLYSMCEDKNQNLWFSGYSGIYRFDGQNWYNVAQNAGLKSQDFDEIITDSNGNIWFNAPYNGVYKYDGNALTYYSRAAYFNNGYLVSLAAGPDGSIWVATDWNGIYRYDGGSWTHFTAEQGLATNSVRAMAFFKDGRLAVVTNYFDISIYDGTSWETENPMFGYQDIYDMAIDWENNIWLATINGLARHKDSETQFYLSNTSGWNYVTFVSVDKYGHVWAGLYNTGLLSYDGTDWNTCNEASGLSASYLRDILFDSRGRTWVLAENGINMSADFTGIDDPESEPAEKARAYPNPFSGSFDIQYWSNMAGQADIHIFSADGRLIGQYNHKKVDIGENIFHFEADNWQNGILFCKIIMAGSSENIKLLKVSK